MPSFPVADAFPVVATPCHGDTTPVISLFDLTGKTAVVTGGNGGIGGGMARGLAEAGADIIIFQVPGETSDFATTLAAETGRRVDVYEVDLLQPDLITATVDKVLHADQRSVDILCNCAGITGGFVPVLDETDAHREQVVQIHFHAVYSLSQKFGAHFAQRGRGGKIINIASLAAHRAMTRFSVYGPIKAAVAQLTNSLATELAAYHVQVNTLTPGWIHTPLSQKTVDNPERSAQIVAEIPAGRWGRPADFKGVAVFLASAASDYITGAEIFVDGGTHTM
ncbi:2-deoxy-D-gluconate 3-dehydrogenase [Sporothrix brasiliensis 5110]|uniref:2-deoxy-D-gluconate 3-dehydrogenase n=1 Tax=Sporothrix brasiliensis 5110 TaxID=1398154 RepID=A0A0C2INJ6_9PEZI|nr:2-deoxy-D-gluconate 3-dehydrogenase [Sporothrix brasiliensis 5110]KIH88555.1 2-deoxy-D-gluconate 3-dehydrogenase [Sporothrix brasiliensis 5110]